MDGWDAYWLDRICAATDCGQAGIHRHGCYAWCSRHVPSEALTTEVARLTEQLRIAREALEAIRGILGTTWPVSQTNEIARDALARLSAVA